MGDNGAGKSTLVKIIAGNFPPDPRPHDGSTATTCISTGRSMPAPTGIEVVYQDLALADNLTRRRQRVSRPRAEAPDRTLRVSRSCGHERAARWNCSGAQVGDAPATTSSAPCRAVSARPWPSPARGSRKAKLILMDEPTAAISVRQVAEVLDLIRRLRDGGDRGHPDLPPHARRVLASVDGSSSAPRHEGRRQAHRSLESRGGHGPDHRRAGVRLMSEASRAADTGDFSNVGRTPLVAPRVLREPDGVRGRGPHRDHDRDVGSQFRVPQPGQPRERRQELLLRGHRHLRDRRW